MPSPAGYQTSYQPCIQLDIKDGIALVGSDAHLWNNKPSTAVRAFLKFTKELKPKAVILNGDVLDFPRISRHPKIAWQSFPTPKEEIEAAQDLLANIENTLTRGSHKIWTMGNHDTRFSSKLSNVAPDYAYVRGCALEDHFPTWDFAWSALVNKESDPVLIKHRFKGGVHAPHTNVLWTGCSIITGHLHSQKVSPLTDFLKTKYGVDTGCLADPKAPCFIDYTEAGPLNWRSGFCVLTFVKGQLLPPELVSVWGENQVVFRGQMIKV